MIPYALYAPHGRPDYRIQLYKHLTCNKHSITAVFFILLGSDDENVVGGEGAGSRRSEDGAVSSVESDDGGEWVNSKESSDTAGSSATSHLGPRHGRECGPPAKVQGSMVYRAGQPLKDIDRK